ncbi:MAG: type II toxin-antitoxin system VapC family toxin [Planctomycetia bacterium]|nr:type II toxin-antitoxin system VapC family toxin [Planctomycetia bacterium]
MKYVLDASVALKWVLDEPHVERALLLREEYEIHRSIELIAPDIFSIEIAHVLSKGYRQGKFSADEADDYLADLTTSAPVLMSSQTLLPRAFRISQETRTGIYDALYLALGEAERVQVVTADERMAKLPFDVVFIDDFPLSGTDPRRIPR